MILKNPTINDRSSNSLVQKKGKIAIIRLLLIMTSTSSVTSDSPKKWPRTASIESNSGRWIPGSNNSFPHLNFEKLARHQIAKRSFYPNASPNLISSKPLTNEEANFIVDRHNWLRRFVSATNMQRMYWDDSLAATAQSYAEQCNFQHSKGRPGTGENIWAGPWDDFYGNGAVRMWFDEVSDPECECGNSYAHCCGHYIQVVWAETNRVGCGYAQCSSVEYAPEQERYVLICHYSPPGNVVLIGSEGELIGLPAFRWTTPENGACSECPEGSVCHWGLCDLSPTKT